MCCPQQQCFHSSPPHAASCPILCSQRITLKLKAYSLPGAWDYAARNIGIRRACGRFVLVGSAGDVQGLSEGFWSIVAARGVKEGSYHRMARVSVRETLSIEALSW